MSKRAIIVSGLMHAVVLLAATFYFVRNFAFVPKAPVVVPIELVMVAPQVSVAPQVQKTLSIPAAQPMARVDVPNVAIESPNIPEAVDVEPAPEVAEAAPAPEAESEPVPISPSPPTEVAQASPALSPIESEEHELRERLPAPVGVRLEGPKLSLDMIGDVLFDLDSAELRPQARMIIRLVAEELSRHGFKRIDVNGYTDTSGTFEHNQRLSTDRANAVAEELARNGIDPTRIRAQGHGTDQLVVQTPEGVYEPRNRRVQIILEPSD